MITAPGEIWIGHGYPSPLLPERAGRKKVALVVQPGAAQLTEAATAGLGEWEVVRVDVPDGEAAKDLAVVSAVYDAFEGSLIGRLDTVVSVGGGSTTDLDGPDGYAMRTMQSNGLWHPVMMP